MKKTFLNLLARIRALSPQRQDALLAAALCAVTAPEIAVQLHASPRPVLTMVTMLGVCACLALRRRAPTAMATLALGWVLVFERFGEVSDWMLPSIAVLLLMYTVGAHLTGRRALLAGTWLTAAAFAVSILDPSNRHNSALGQVFNAVMFALLPLAVGRALGNRRALTAALRAKAEQLEREREDRAREAATAERTRIARELHDVVAHSVSVMVIQTEAARRIAAENRDGAIEALRSVEHAGRDAVREMRRMVGVLRRGEGDFAAAAAPGMSQLPALVERARAAGLPVELRIAGQERPLPPGLDLAAYRIVQEALTNAIKHAGPARARIAVRYAPGQLELEVSDTGRGPSAAGASDPGGQGLIGMRERLVLYGGELTAGRRRGGGFAVRARIPLEAEELAA